jgi:hypothetical protein
MYKRVQESMGEYRRVRVQWRRTEHGETTTLKPIKPLKRYLRERVHYGRASKVER